MAKAKTAAAPKKVKKAAKAVKAVAKASPKPAKKTGKKKADGKGAEMLWKLAEHPLVGELLAIGATAAVAAIAEGSGKDKNHRLVQGGEGSRQGRSSGDRRSADFANLPTARESQAAKAKPAKAKPAKA